MTKDDNSLVGQVQFAKCLSALYRLFTESNSSLNGSENGNSSKCTSYNVSSEENNINCYERWVKCWCVWRKLIDNDVILLALLFHSGSVWSPNYAQLHSKKLKREEVLEREEEQQRQNGDTGSSTKMCNNNTSISSFHKKMKEEKYCVLSEAAAAVRSTTSENNAVGKLKKNEEEEQKEELKTSQTKQSQPSRLNPHLRKYLERMQEIPESIWALNVLHFLRLVEVYELCGNNSSNMYKSQPVLENKSKDAELHVEPSARSYNNIVEENNEDNVSGLSSTLVSSSSSTSSSSSSVCSFEEKEKSADIIIVKKKRNYTKKVKREEQKELYEEYELGKESQLHSRGRKENNNNKHGHKRKRLLLKQPTNQSNQNKQDNTLTSECNTEECKLSEKERYQARQKDLSENVTNIEESEEKHKVCTTNNANSHHHVEWDTSMSYTLRLDDLLSCCSFNPMKLTYQQYLEQQTIQLKEALSALGDVSSQINVLKGIVTCTFRDEVMVQTVASALVDEWFEFFNKKGEELEECKVDLFNRNTTHKNVKQHHMVRDYFLSSAIKFASLVQTIGSQSTLLHKANESAQEFDDFHLLHLHHIMLRQEFTLDKAEVHDVFCRAIPSIFTVYLLEEFEQSQQQENHQQAQHSLFSSLQLLSLPFHYCFAPHTWLNINVSECQMQKNTREKWISKKCFTSSSIELEQSNTHLHEFTLALEYTKEETGSSSDNKCSMETRDDKNTVAKMRKGKAPMIAPFSHATSKQRGRPNASKQVQSAKSLINNYKKRELFKEDKNKKENCTLNVNDVFVAEFNNINERSLFMREIARYNEKSDELESQASHTDYSTSVNFVKDHDFTHYANNNSSKGRNWRRSRRDKYKRRRFGGLFDTDETDFTFVNLTSSSNLSVNNSKVKVLCKESQMHDKIALVEETAHVEVISVHKAISALFNDTTSSTAEKTKQSTLEKRLLLFYSPSLPSSQFSSSSPHETQLLTPNTNLVCNGTCISKGSDRKHNNNNYYSHHYKGNNTYYNLHALSSVNATVTFLFTTAKRVIAMHASKSSFFRKHKHHLDHSESCNNNSNHNNVSMLVSAVQCALHALILLTCLDPIVYRCDNTSTIITTPVTTAGSAQRTNGPSVEHNNKVEMEWLQRKLEIASFIVEVCVSSELPSNTLLQIGFMTLLVLWHSSCARTAIIDENEVITTTTVTTIGDCDNDSENKSANEYTLQWQLTLIAIKLFATLAQREVECVNFNSHTSNTNNNQIDKIKNEVNVDNIARMRSNNNNKCVVEERSIHRLPAPWWSSFRSAVIKRENLQCYIPAAWSAYMFRVEEIVQVAMQQFMLARRHVVHPTEHTIFEHVDKREVAFRTKNNEYEGKKLSQINNKYKQEDELEREEQQKVQEERELAQNEKGNINNEDEDEFSDEEIVNEEDTSQIILSDAQPCYYGSSVVCSSVPLVHIVEETSMLTLDKEEEEEEEHQVQQVQQKSSKLYHRIDGDDDNDDVELLPYLPPHLRQDNRTTNNVHRHSKTSNNPIKLHKNRESSKKLNKAASMLWLSLEGVVNCDSLHTSSVVSTPRWSESDE